MTWSREELVESIIESIHRKEEYLRKIEREELYQKSLYELLNQILSNRRPELPQAFDPETR